MYPSSFKGLDDCIVGEGGCRSDVVIFPRENGFTIHGQFGDDVA
jgi:hypothetical protein